MCSIAFLLYIPFVFLYEVSFKFKCDDYCITLIDGTSQKNIGKGGRYQTRSFKGDFSLNNPIGIYIYNDDRAFGISGKADFKYFVVTTTKQDLWRSGQQGETCYNISFTKGSKSNNERFILIPNTHNDFNSIGCTFFIDNNFCKENIYYIPNEERGYHFIDLVLFEKGDKYNDMKIKFDFEYPLLQDFLRMKV